MVFSQARSATISPEAALTQTLAQVRQEGRFPATTTFAAFRLDGVKQQALLLDEGGSPSMPGQCGMFIVFAVFEGKLKPLAEPHCGLWDVDVQAGSFQLKRYIPPAPDGPIVDLTGRSTGLDVLAQVDVLEIEYFTGYFTVRFPIKVDFAMGRLRPERQCLRMMPPDGTSKLRYEDLCDYHVVAERQPEESDDTFVRLFSEPDETLTPRHVVVKPTSKVEFLAARTANIMDAQGAWNGTFDNTRGEVSPWLKVRIDGKVGWVRAEEDLEALGLHWSD